MKQRRAAVPEPQETPREESLVRWDAADGIATITLDSPRNRNALSVRLRADLAGALDSALGDDSIRVIVLTHTGTVFSAGADLKEARQGLNTAGVPLTDILETVWHAPKPVIARLAGPARAGALGLVSCCDVAIADANVTFAFSEVRIGVVPAVISVTVLPSMFPRSAHELFLTGEVFDAQRAVETGLINAAVPSDELDATVAQYAEAFILAAPGALAATKALLREAGPEDLRGELAAKQKLSEKFFSSAEAREGISAFTEKRRPAWAVVPSSDRVN
ncbi:enoyl-CoA hydratase-related protein [Nocardia sp. NPDC052278]|uniref:enoyl-CoA hydratase-related protein n=1 Tax=unclassified Nocardia TaxID=2637762 RepID=UPI00368E6CEE